MKKSLLVIPAISAALTVPAFLLSEKPVSARATSDHIEINADFFTNWSDDAGSFGDENSTFWNEHHAFNSMGSFFRGEDKEGWTGTLTSVTWQQSTQYVYFTWSAQNNSDDVNITFHYGTYSATLKNDTFVENTMMLHHFKIPDEEFATFNGQAFSMYVELYDNATSNYGFNNFGYLHINQSVEQVSDAMRYYLNHLDTDNSDWSIDRHKEIYGHYFANAYLREVFLRTVSDVSEDFESNTEFVKHWYRDYNYDNNDSTTRYIDSLISSSEYRPDDGTNMPFNKTGNGFFKGWAAEGSGYTATDGAIYRFVSRPFVLGGNGLVSIKMAGRAASLHVIDTATQQDLAWIDCEGRSFNGSGDDDIIATGKNVVTMVRYYINLEEFVGKTIQFALADVFDSGWAASYFDELVAKYTSYPVLGVEEVEQNSNKGTSYAALRDIYINGAKFQDNPELEGYNPYGVKYNSATVEELPTEDLTPINEAYDFVCFYFDNFRTSESFYSFCSVSSELKAQLLSKYAGLSSLAKTIVDSSLDYDRGLDRTGNWYEKHVNQEYTIGYIVEYIANRFPSSDPNSNRLLGIFHNNVTGSVLAVIVIFATVTTLAAGLFFIIRKRKAHK